MKYFLSLFIIVLLTGCANNYQKDNNNPYVDQKNVFKNIYFISINDKKTEKGMNEFTGFGTAKLAITDGEKDFDLPWTVTGYFHEDKLMTNPIINYPIDFDFLGENNVELEFQIGRSERPLPLDVILKNWHNKINSSGQNLLQKTVNLSHRNIYFNIPSSIFDYELTPDSQITCNINAKSFRFSNSLCSTTDYGNYYIVEKGNLSKLHDEQHVYDFIEREDNILKWGFDYEITGSYLDQIKRLNPKVNYRRINEYLVFENYLNDVYDKYVLTQNGVKYEWPPYYNSSMISSYCHPKDSLIIEQASVHIDLEQTNIYDNRCSGVSGQFQSQYFWVNQNNIPGYIFINRDSGIIKMVQINYLNNNEPFKTHTIVESGELVSFKATKFYDESITISQ